MQEQWHFSLAGQHKWGVNPLCAYKILN